jgi:hypothetical protein
LAAPERWVAIAGIAEGELLFRSIKNGGQLIRGRLNPDGMDLVFKAAVARYLEACGHTREAAAIPAAKYACGRLGALSRTDE